jgi:hypothetical protein
VSAAPYRPGSPAWRAGYEHARRQAFGIATTAGDPAHRIAQMQPEAPKRDVDGDEMMARFAGKAVKP